MIHPLDNLRSDHALVAKACAALHTIAEEVQAGLAFPAADTALLLRCIRDFGVAVRFHKASTWLLQAIVMRGDNDAAAAAGEAARLHEEATELVHSLVLFWEPGELSAAEREGFTAAARALLERVTRLARIEEDTLFPACCKLVPADDLLEWVEQFSQVERERGSAAVWRQRLSRVLARWAT